MGRKMLIYHGSPEIIRVPEYGAGRLHNDYGRGFYCTEDPEIAKEWACSSSDDGFSNRYELDLTHLKVLDLNTEEYTILNWMAVLVENRVFSINTPISGRGKKYLLDHFLVNVNSYDVVKGYRADDAYYNFADLFLNNGITLEQLAQVMRLGKLGEQIVLKSKWAFDNICFLGFETADHNYYYSKRKARTDRAELDFMMISGEDADGLYMADIIRERITNNDERIPRNVPEKRDD